MSMKKNYPRQLHLRTTGGMGITLEGSVDIDALPDNLATQIQTELTPRKLSRVARRKSVSFAPGQQEYEITLITGDKREPKRYAFTDQQADPELLDLMDELTSIIIEEKIRARRARRSTQTEAEALASTPDEPISMIGEEVEGGGEETAAVPEDDIADSSFASASSG